MGKEPVKTKVIAASYSKALSLISSRTIRNKIKEEKTNPLSITYGDIFPDTKLSEDNAGVDQWSLDSSYFSFKAASVGSGVTGMGASVLLADDLIADSFTANNPNELDKINSWFFDTFASREEAGEESNAISILVGTFWSSQDYLNRIINDEKKAEDYYVIRMAAYDKETDTMLCPGLLSREQFEYLKDNMDFGIFSANYLSQTIDEKNKLYTDLIEFEKAPESIKETICLVDPADDGKDSFCAIVSDIGADGKGYIKDVLFTKENMDVTTDKLAKMLTEHNVRRCKIEANSFGRLFSKNVTEVLRNKYKNSFTQIQLFHQTKNKEARIFTYAHVVQREILFPLNWKTRYSDFFAEMNSYSKNGRNQHDDAPDCASLLAEELLKLKSQGNGALSASMLGF